MKTMNYKAKEPNKEGGFVLPYVLLVIAILSVSLMLIAERIRSTSTLMIEMEAQFTANLAMNSAQSEAIYAFLTAVPAPDGYELNPEGITDVFSSRQERENPIDVWRADGEIRKTNTAYGPVLTEYRDGSGFIPINGIDRENLLALVRSFGVSEQQQRSLVAKLLDYIDEDIRRQFLGGERADYRLRQLSPPTNASLRKIAELNNVMDWKQVVDKIGYHGMIERVTLNPRITAVKKAFIEPELLEEFDFEQSDMRPIDDMLLFDNYPTDVARFTFYYQTRDNKLIRRKIEVDKTIAVLERPFSTVLLYQDQVEQGEREENINGLFLGLDGRKHVIYAETYRFK